MACIAFSSFSRTYMLFRFVAVCCTGFRCVYRLSPRLVAFILANSIRCDLSRLSLCSVIGALFLFVVAGLMRNNYRYVHIHGDLDGLSRPVTYAAFVYLAFAAISLFFWIRGSMRARAGTHTQLH